MGCCPQVADTGLDMKNCYFNDTRGNVAATTYSAAAFDLTRRKVVQYVSRRSWRASIISPANRPARWLVKDDVYDPPACLPDKPAPRVMLVFGGQVAWTDSTDVSTNGHGTHVSGGSAAGTVYEVGLELTPGCL